MSRRIYEIHILLQKARRYFSCTQEELGQKTGLGKSLIASLESGKVKISCDKLVKFSKATGCSFWIRPEGISLLDGAETIHVNKCLIVREGMNYSGRYRWDRVRLGSNSIKTTKIKRTVKPKKKRKKREKKKKPKINRGYKRKRVTFK